MRRIPWRRSRVETMRRSFEPSVGVEERRVVSGWLEGREVI